MRRADSLGFALLAEGDELADLLDGERRARGVALRALDGDKLRLFVDGASDALIVERPVRKQIDLPVLHAVLRERAGRGADADDLLERVIRAADRAQKLVARQQVRAQRDGQRVRAAGDLRAHERRLRMEAVGIDALEVVAPLVVVAVARRRGEVRRVDAVFPFSEPVRSFISL